MNSVTVLIENMKQADALHEFFKTVFAHHKTAKEALFAHKQTSTPVVVSEDAARVIGRDNAAEMVKVEAALKTPLEQAIAETQKTPTAEESGQDPFALLSGSLEPAATEATETAAAAEKKPAKKTTKKKDEPAVEDKPLTIADIRAKGEIVCTELGLPAIQSTLAKFGAERMSDLKVADYGLVVQHFGKIMNDAGKVLA
jgi:hypothetical protein